MSDVFGDSFRGLGSLGVVRLRMGSQSSSHSGLRVYLGSEDRRSALVKMQSRASSAQIPLGYCP